MEQKIGFSFPPPSKAMLFHSTMSLPYTTADMKKGSACESRPKICVFQISEHWHMAQQQQKRSEAWSIEQRPTRGNLLQD